MTIMFTDLVGSAALADGLGEEAAQALRRAQERILGQQFERLSGKVIKDTGDGFMVGFASAHDGVECAVAVQRAIAIQHAEGRYQELMVRIGLHTGEPMAEGGDLHGSDVNLAFRIMAEAEGGQVLVSDVTRVLARRVSGLEFKRLGERNLKGFADPVPLFEVRWPEDGVGQPRLTRFVGRAEESARLRQLLERAMSGQGSLVLVGGEPGVGKTRLASELAIYAGDRGVRVLTGRAYDTEGMPPYLPLTEALTPHVRSHSPDELRAELNGNAPYVAKLLPELRRLLPNIPEPPQMSPEAERYALFEGVSDFLLKIAGGTQLLMFLDDLHWADGGTLLLLQHLTQRLAQAPLLVVGTYRDVEVDAQHPLAGLLAELTRQRLGSNITLRPFDRDEATVLVEAALGQTAAPQAMDALFSAAAGNPFFTEEVVRHLVEQGRDLTDPQTAVGDWEIPEGVRQVIARRLGRLGEEAGQVLAYSSVLGRDLSLSKVALVTGKEENALLDLLDGALSAHVLRAEREGYAFAHPLIRETLYQALSAPRRRQLHRRTAEALEALYGADPEPQQLVELAHHYYQAAPGGDVEKAIDYAVKAGERAETLLAYEEAARLYETALSVLEIKKPDENRAALIADLRLKRGNAFASAGMWTDARRELEAGLQSLAPERIEERAEALVHLSTQCYWLVDMPAVRRYATEAAELAGEVGRPDLAAGATGWAAFAVAAEGEIASSMDQCRHAIALAREGDIPPFAQASLQHFPLMLYWTGQFEEAVECARESVQEARKLNNVSMMIMTLPHLGLALAAIGRYEEAIHAFQEGNLLGRKYGHALLARAIGMSAGFHRDVFDFARAEALAEEARELARSFDFVPPLVSSSVELLQNFAQRQEVGRAEKLLGEVGEHVEKAGGFHGWLWRLRVADARAMLALTRGNFDEALSWSGEVIAKSRATGRVKYQATGLATRAKTIAAMGREKEAISDLRTAVELARPTRDPAMLLHAAAALLAVEGDDALAAEARKAVDRIATALPGAEMRSNFETAEPVRLVLGLTP